MVPEEKRRALSLLGKLAKSAGVFPRCYELRGVEYNRDLPVAGGGFAEVFRGEYEGEAICLKVVRVYQKQEADEVLRVNVNELTLWAHLQHENILPFYGTYLDPPTQRICLVSPWMENGNLRDYLDRFPQIPRMPFIRDIIDGLQHLHDLNIVHRDLKAQNVVVSDDGRALITDFGLSFVLATTTVTSSGGTIRFMAPEIVVEDSQPTASSDIWSFACLCYEVLTDKMPFYQYKDVQVMRALMNKEVPLRPKRGAGVGHSELDDSVWRLLIMCWNYAPQDRPHSKTIKQTVRAKAPQVSNDRQNTSTKAGGPQFWRDMKNKSNHGLDYAHVEEVLLGVTHVEEILLRVSAILSLASPQKAPRSRVPNPS